MSTDTTPPEPTPTVPTPTEPVPAEPTPPLERLHPAAITRWRIATLARGALLAAASLAADWLVDTPVPFALPALVVASLAIATAVFLPPLQYRAWGFAVRDADLYLRHGVFFRTTTIVPHARIQHVDTRHGPLDRWLGLADLIVFTAGTRGAIVSVPALGMSAAGAMRDHLVELSGAGDAV